MSHLFGMQLKPFEYFMHLENAPQTLFLKQKYCCENNSDILKIYYLLQHSRTELTITLIDYRMVFSQTSL